MSAERDVRWTRSRDPHLILVAETLGCPPDLVMAVWDPEEGERVALFTPGYPEDHTVWSARLAVDPETGELLEIDREARPGAWEQLEAELQQHPER